MKVFKVVFLYARGEYSKSTNKLGAEYFLSETAEAAKKDFGYANVIDVIEVTTKDVESV